MNRIDALRMRLHKMWDAPLADRVRLWRELYQDCPHADRDRMHQLAYDFKLGAATGEEWIRRREDVTEPGQQSPPPSPSTATMELRPYRGYGLQATVEQHPDTTWSARCSVHNSDWRPIHHFAVAHFFTADDAMRAAMRSAADYVDARKEASARDPAKSADHLPDNRAWRPKAGRIVWLSDPTGAHSTVRAYRQRQHAGRQDSSAR